MGIQNHWEYGFKKIFRILEDLTSTFFVRYNKYRGSWILKKMSKRCPTNEADFVTNIIIDGGNPHISFDQRTNKNVGRNQRRNSV